MRKSTKGFTIVELLIVIVVIGILAAITIVAYNGIQTRAKNTKTVNAAVSWIKALKLYNADKGTWPTGRSCLGSSTTYVGDGGQCWNGYTVTSSLLTNMQPYLSSYPEPDTTYVNGATTIRRGILYDTNGTIFNLYLLIIGSGSCPGIGVTLITTGTYSGGYFCQYDLTA